MMDCISAVCLCFAMNNLCAIFVGNAHHRGIAVGMHVLFFIFDGWSYIQLEAPNGVPPAIYVIVPVGLIGLIIHAMEPGVFTKDKEGAIKNKKG